MIPYKLPMRALEFIRDHVTFKLPYDFSYHMETPQIQLNLSYTAKTAKILLREFALVVSWLSKTIDVIQKVSLHKFLSMFN